MIPEFADLPRRWREAPSTARDRKCPLELTKGETLSKYFALAVTQPLVREGLDNLYGELVLTRQPIPHALSWWIGYIHMVGGPPANRGPRHEIDEYVRVGAIFKFLGTRRYSRERAIGRITETMGYSEEAIRTIIRKLSPNPPKDTDGRREGSGRGWVRELQGRWPGLLG